MIGASALYCSSSHITSHISWHFGRGIDRIAATLHNPTESQLEECRYLSTRFQVRFFVHNTGGPITMDQQVVWSNNAVTELIKSGCTWLGSFDDDEYLMGFPHCTPASWYSGWCYHSTEIDRTHPNWAASMVYRDPDSVHYEFSKIWFHRDIWTKFSPGLHVIVNLKENPVTYRVIKHFSYRAAKPMFSHRQDVHYPVLTADDVEEQRLIKDTTVSDWIHLNEHP